LLDGSSSAKNFPLCLKALDNTHVIYALTAGILFNLSNILLCMAIRLIGISLAFFLTTGLSLLLSTIISYSTTSLGDPGYLFGGCGLVLLAVVCSGLVFKFTHTDQTEVTTIADTVVDNPKMYQPEVSPYKTLFLCVISGIFQSIWYSLVNLSVYPYDDPNSLTPYSALFFVGISVLITTFPICYFFAKKPVIGGSFAPSQEYFTGGLRWHFQAATAGCIWALGTLFFLMGYPILQYTTYHIGQMYPFVGLLWGLIVWKEFGFLPPSGMIIFMISFMVLSYYGGITLIILSLKKGESE